MVSAVGVDFPDAAVEAAVVDGLASVEAMLLATAHPDDKLLTEVSRHLLAAGGKRFRAMLVLLAAQFGSPADPRVVPAAVAIELTHLATLFHDDVMDEAEIRRGSESVNSRWNNSVAILAGDFLFAEASRILADLGPDAVRIQAETFNRLVTGQLAETVGPKPGQDLLEHYMYVINEKTGSLIATSGLFGAMFSGAPASVTLRIARACEQLGIAWQLSDDVIDVASDTAQSGKTPGTDLREGVPTLPVLYALRSASSPDGNGSSSGSPALDSDGSYGPRAGASGSDSESDSGGDRLRWLLTEADLTSDALLAEALGLLRDHSAMAAARADVLSYANNARAEFMALPDVPARAAFLALCDYVVKRTGLPKARPPALVRTRARPHRARPLARTAPARSHGHPRPLARTGTRARSLARAPAPARSPARPLPACAPARSPARDGSATDLSRSEPFVLTAVPLAVCWL